MKMNAEFYFHPVGQGCFYSGLIHLKENKRFSFVYDCGTDSSMHYLENEVDRFKYLINNELDLLIISHFDADHVNGVVRLLRGTHCRRLIIPYYTPVERLLLYTTTTSTDDDYRRMLQNPIAFFGNDNDFRIDQIVVVGGSEGETGVEGGNTILPSSGGDTPSNEELEKEEFSFNDELARERDSDTLKNYLEAQGDSVSYMRNLLFFKTPYKVRIGSRIWEFAFYLREMDKPILLRDFTNDVDTILKKGVLSIFELFEDDNIDELKETYRKYYGQNLNTTSLVTYHGPLIQCAYSYWCNAPKYCTGYPYHHHHHMHNHYHKPGTLLMGDIDIKSHVKLNNLVNYFNAYLSRVCVFQVPHHGSKDNWPVLRANHDIHNFCHYVINHGVGRKHHPSTEVVSNLMAKCVSKMIHLNNEIYPMYYRLFF